MDYVIGVDIGTQSTKALLVGAAHADLWMQIISDVTGYTVYTIREEVEAALGASLLTSSVAGAVDSAAVVQGWIRLYERTRPRQRYHILQAGSYRNPKCNQPHSSGEQEASGFNIL